LCTNVLEHIEDEARTLANFYDLLTEGGRVVLLVPAHPALHGSMDAHLGHYRRYTRDRLAQLMRDAGFAVEHLEHVNRIAVAGWYLNSKILRRKDVPAFQAYLFDRLVPMLRLEKYWRMPVGLSLIAVGRKPVSSASATTAVTELLAANM
jgi:SAM-dependent methyltransferase